MEIGVKVQAVRGDITKTGGPLVAVNLYQGVKKPQGATLALDTALDGLIGRALDAGDFKGGRGEKLLLYPEAKKGLPERVLLLGLGDKDTFDAEAARAVGGTLADACRQLKVKKAATVVHGGDSGKPVDELARGLVEGLLLGLYRYDNWFRDGRAQELALAEVSIVEKLAGKMVRVRRGVETGVEVALAVNTARELANGPSNEVTPSHIAEAARSLGRKHGFKVQVFDADRCAKEGMGAFLGVAKGSDEPCKFLVMEYAPSRPRGTVCFVGKGITFDSGGISIKPAAEMDKMKFDMSGAAAVLGAMRYAASRKVPVKVVGLVAATENLPGGHAYKPGDILTSSAGVTIEVLNTDAEGRLVLSDALNYARKFDPDAVIDLATLTGACVIALGEHAAGLMANDEWILDQVFEAGVGSGERVWRGARVAASALVRVPEHGEERGGRHPEHGGTRGGNDHRGRVPGRLHQRLPLGASRHRGDGLGLQGPELPDRGERDRGGSPRPGRVPEPLEEAEGGRPQTRPQDLAP